MEKKVQNNYPTIIVHGFLGVCEGKYNYFNYLFRYFGGFTGDVVKSLKAMGYEVYLPGLGAFAPVWDRCCDLYAYIFGGTVDYGKVHSEKYGHARYGRTYPGVLKDLGTAGDHAKVNLVGHSFGGPTLCLFSSLMEKGAAEEVAGTPADELSPFFKGGQGHLIHSVTTLNGTNTGTTLVEMLPRAARNAAQTGINMVVAATGKSAFNKVIDFKMDEWGFTQDPELEPEGFRNPMGLMDLIKKNSDSDENMFHQMSVEYSRKLNAERYCMIPGTYYFAQRCVRTHPNKKGKHNPNVTNMMPLFDLTAPVIGRYTNKAIGIDESWFPNDGMVPLPSQGAPENMPSVDYVQGVEIKPGIWYNMPVTDNDHESMVGMFVNNDKTDNRFAAILESFKYLPDA
ncbi:MAG: hypothetical protein ILO43_08330 [Clostridia bacterium]|nr:hypothetical protein [Clostridia bacterium]